ncbi:hypothetical protein NHX12_015606 [Muraenolepis orangiensis]|uniref:MEIOB-like N-terminal domain-containing protein n=1 Tax=Muraenolepis orangiensis TaxID=630683 RepID=A0A9Q0D8G2_9TELE|nr:hypothetical protein NHX12_015606 [Muraenolepis orangiensis]
MSTPNNISICELHPDISNPRVVGVVIGKTDVRSFPDGINLAFTFSFTLKDSPEYWINVSAWGSDEYISVLSGSFTIGDCMVVENPLVSNKNPEKDEKFCPTTPSFYRLLISEACLDVLECKYSQVLLCTDMSTADRLLPLLHLPGKDPRDFHSLGDIVINGPGLDGRVLNILAAVRSIAELKLFTTSDGRKGQRLEVKLFDYSMISFSLVCHISKQQGEKPETINFRANLLRMLHITLTTTVNDRVFVSVIDTKEASQLYSYAKEMSSSGALEDDDRPEDTPEVRDSCCMLLVVVEVVDVVEVAGGGGGG